MATVGHREGIPSPAAQPSGSPAVIVGVQSDSTAVLDSSPPVATDSCEVSTPGEGCTLGCLKEPGDFDSRAAPYEPGDLFSDHFEDAFPGVTLLDVPSRGGGGLKGLGRHTVVALLSAASPDVYCRYSPAAVIDMLNKVSPVTKAEYEALKNELGMEDEKGLPSKPGGGGQQTGQRERRQGLGWAAHLGRPSFFVLLPSVHAARERQG